MTFKSKNENMTNQLAQFDHFTDDLCSNQHYRDGQKQYHRHFSTKIPQVNRKLVMIKKRGLRLEWSLQVGDDDLLVSQQVGAYGRKKETSKKFETFGSAPFP